VRDSAVSENKMATKLPNGERPAALQPASGCRFLQKKKKKFRNFDDIFNFFLITIKLPC
jgi:hypothetical protein